MVESSIAFSASKSDGYSNGHCNTVWSMREMLKENTSLFWLRKAVEGLPFKLYEAKLYTLLIHLVFFFSFPFPPTPFFLFLFFHFYKQEYYMSVNNCYIILEESCSLELFNFIDLIWFKSQWILRWVHKSTFRDICNFTLYLVKFFLIQTFFCSFSLGFNVNNTQLLDAFS